MKLASSGPFVGIAAGLLFSTASLALDLNQDRAPEDYLFGTGMGLPVQNREELFRPASNRANFTFFHGVENAAVEQGKLAFTLVDKRALLGWGNYAGKQPAGQVQDMGQQTIVVRLRLRQSGDRSQWTVWLWRDAERLEPTAEAAVEGRDWQELEFKALRTDGANPDGLEFAIDAPPGTRFELEWLKLIQPTYEGSCRTEFVLPEGKIWRATADVGSMNHRHWTGRDEMASRLSINGKVVQRRGAKHLYHTAPVDIAPYLRPGRNCIGFYGFRIGYPPFLYFQAKIVMESGEVVTVASGKDWKYSPRASEGWDQPGFDDSSWTNVDRGTSPELTSRDAAGQFGIPAYSGRLVIKNPSRKDLFYTDADEVLVDVHVPPGLEQRHPSLSYIFGRADHEGRCELVQEGSLASFSKQEGSLVYRLGLGRQVPGVYALALRLAASDETTIDQRTREPLVVLRKRAPKRIEGNDYLEGLDLELEDTLDFTDPNDPHPWTEAKMPSPMLGPVAEKVDTPVIVRKDGLEYREVADGERGSGFSYRIEFEHPGSFYLIELEYPDDARRTIEVVTSSKTEGVWTNSQSGVGAETGGRFLNSGTMQKLRWIHVADPGPHSIDVINVVRGEPSAAKALKIYRIRGELPSVAAGSGRSYGIHTERCFFTSGIGMNFGVGMPKNPQAARKLDQTLPPMQLCLRDLVWMHETGGRYVEYLQFAGQNCHVMGCFQYADYNTPFAPAAEVEDSRVLPCMKTMLANLLQTAGIDFYAGVEFSQSTDVRTYANDAQVAQGADTLWMVDSQGRQRYGHDKVTVVPNWMHPEVRTKYRQLLEDLSRTFGHLDRFRGVHGLMGPTVGAGYWIPAFGSGSDYDQPLVASYDDRAMDRFERETGVELPVPSDDPQRFTKRASLLQTPRLRERFIEWRCEKVREFFAEAVGTLKEKRPNLRLVNVLAVEDSDFFQYLARSEKPFGEILREFAIDVDRLNTVEGLCTGRWTLSWRQARPLVTRDPFCWLARTRPDVISTFPQGPNRFVFVRTSWDENMLPSGGYAMKDRNDHDRLVESDWIMNGAKIRALPQPGGYHCREAFIQALITADPNLLVGGFTDLNVNVGHEQMLRSVLNTYTHLPRERFTPVLDTGLETNLAIRQLNRPDESWLYVANPCQWHVEGRLLLETDGRIVEVPNGRPAASVRGNGKTELPLRLTPFGLVAYRVDAPGLAVTAYTTEPMEPAELARLVAIPDRVGKLLADPAARLSLAPDDHRFMRDTLAGVRQAVGDGRYALAWSLITHHRFWTLWQDFLEEAVADPTRVGIGRRAISASDAFLPPHPDPLPPSEREIANQPRPAAAPDSPAPQPGTVIYDPQRNCIQVIGFPEDQPATMETILAADKRNGWGKVTCDESTDTYTVDADLWIGDDVASGTFLQLGDREHPRPTVVVRGTVWVRPPRESPPRSDGLASVVNRLTLGDPENDEIRATLQIDCQSRGEHGLYVGYRSHDGKTIIHRGSLHVYHGTITAAVQDDDHAWGVRDYTTEESSPRWATPGWYASDVRLIHATISWFEGCVPYGTSTGKLDWRQGVDGMRPNELVVIRGTTFEHGEAAVRNGQHYLENCTFRHMQAAVAEGGALSAKLVGCTFEENDANWTLGSIQSGGIVLVDCRVGPPRAPMAIQKNRIDPEKATRGNIPLYPDCRVRQTLVVRVVDAAGEPVPDAFVAVACPDHPGEVTRGATVTDQNGLTPPDPDAGAIVITTKKHEATDEPNSPETSTFEYQITLEKKGYRPASVSLASDRPVPKPLVITLKK